MINNLLGRHGNGSTRIEREHEPKEESYHAKQGVQNY